MLYDSVFVFSYQKWMSRTSVGVPAFSCDSVLAVVMTTAVVSGEPASTGQDEVEEDEVVDAIMGFVVAGGANDLKNSSTCSKQPRSISWKRQ